MELKDALEEDIMELKDYLEEEDIMELKDALEEDIMELKDDLEEEDIMELKDALEEDIMELKNDLEEALPPLKIVEETVIEDLSVPEIIAQEVIIKDGSITTIGAGPYNGFVQSPTPVRVPAFIAAVREDGEIVSKTIIPVPVPAKSQVDFARGAVIDAKKQINGDFPIRAATVTAGDTLTIDSTAANLVPREDAILGSGVVIQRVASSTPSGLLSLLRQEIRFLREFKSRKPLVGFFQRLLRGVFDVFRNVKRRESGGLAAAATAYGDFLSTESSR